MLLLQIKASKTYIFQFYAFYIILRVGTLKTPTPSSWQCPRAFFIERDCLTTSKKFFTDVILT